MQPPPTRTNTRPIKEKNYLIISKTVHQIAERSLASPPRLRIGVGLREFSVIYGRSGLAGVQKWK